MKAFFVPCVAILIALSACAPKPAGEDASAKTTNPTKTEEPKRRASNKESTARSPQAPKQETPHPEPASRPMVTGWVEKVVVGSQNIKMKARIDTGAKTSSIDAEVIKVFKRDEKRRVLFSIEDASGAKQVFESRLVRFVKIKSKTGKFIRRPVVFMDVCLAGQHIRGEVNLAERGHMNYPMLVGRNMMKERFVVNPAATYLTKPDCAAKAQEE